MAVDKAELRHKLKEARFELADAERTLKSRAIVTRLQEITDWSGVKTLHYFEPLHDLMEVDISGLVTYLEDNFPGTALFTPKQIDGRWQMVSIQRKAAPEQFDIIIVPMLGFDARLHRLGYGGGYYDRFLASQAGARKIGVCYDLGRIESIPTEDHDIALDMIVTETQVYKI